MGEQAVIGSVREIPAVQAGRIGERPAVTVGGHTFSYADLGARAGRAAANVNHGAIPHPQHACSCRRLVADINDIKPGGLDDIGDSPDVARQYAGRDSCSGVRQDAAKPRLDLRLELAYGIDGTDVIDNDAIPDHS